MQDRPTAPELLQAIEEFLRERSNAERDRYMRFQFLVASNSLAILRREWELEGRFLEAEWSGLDRLLGPEPLPASPASLWPETRARNERLCEAIRAGRFDSREAEDLLLAHFGETITNKVRITNPAELD
jgi:hypothetical protein